MTTEKNAFKVYQKLHRIRNMMIMIKASSLKIKFTHGEIWKLFFSDLHALLNILRK